MVVLGEVFIFFSYIIYYFINFLIYKLGLVVEELSFWNVYIDSLFFFVLIGLIFFGVFCVVVRKVIVGVLGKL